MVAALAAQPDVPSYQIAWGPSVRSGWVWHCCCCRPGRRLLLPLALPTSLSPLLLAPNTPPSLGTPPPHPTPPACRRAPEVRVLAEDKTPLGVMSTPDALAEARAQGFDLIMVVPDAQPPVCRIMEFSKYNYELEKASKEAKKRQRESV